MLDGVVEFVFRDGKFHAFLLERLGRHSSLGFNLRRSRTFFR
ncbi:hypothetical protein B8V81_0051 [Paenibacillus pasadenensis]|uniref:Uncharacterized protein n=1 Tax=Paenibacillus pasadenensis TaxID=217090 RepID=A0A2N5NC43_9BACL|nr:hypothetical protein B8V81_0051 [Paenibacillus pasadenensis]